MKKSDLLSSPRLLELKKSRRRAFLGKIFIFILGIVVLIAVLSYISKIDRLNIQNIEIVGNKVIDKEAVRQAVESRMTGSYLWFFPKTNVLFYPKNAISVTLYNKFQRLKSVNLLVKNQTTLEVSLVEREALYTWCGLAPSTTPDDKEQKCYFLDNTGYIFDEAPYFSEEVYFKFYGQPNGSQDEPLGLYFMKDDFGKFISFKKVIESIGLKPIALYINGDNMRISLARAHSLVHPEVILKTDSDLEKVAENLETALTTEPLQSKFKNKYSTLEYIDLRFGNKVYFK